MDINLASQDLTDVPESILDSKIAKLNLDFNDIATLPASLCEKLSNLTVLSVNGNFLETLPSSIRMLTELTELYLKENSLHFLPESIVELKHLRKFHVTGNSIEKIPENIHLMECLTEFVADENAIKCLPCSFGKLSNLSYLSLSCNAIESLPENFGNLLKLKRLDLSDNCLKTLPCSFQDLPLLEVIDFDNNELKFLPDKLLCAKNLTKIILSQNVLESIPAWFSDLENTKELYLSDNYLQGAAFPENFGVNCSTLEKIYLSGNNLSFLPESFGKLKSLTFLDLGSPLSEPERNPRISNGNELTYLPSTFPDLMNLTKLELDENHIEVLPNNFGHLINLLYLDLSHNVLNYLPESFGQLQKLQVCMLGLNCLSHLPKSFGLLTSLQDLKLDNNSLEDLPESFENLIALVSLDLYGNHLKEIPKSLCKMKYLKHLDIGQNDFDIPLEDIPQIMHVPTYAIEDGELKNNYVKRSDIPNISEMKDKADKELEKTLENEILCKAMASASCLWRKHDQSTLRNEVFNVSESITSGIIPNSENDSSVTSPLKNNFGRSSPINAVECWDDDLILERNFSSENSVNEDDAYLSDDWKSDYELEFPDNFSKVYSQPMNDLPNLNMHFILSDLHAKQIDMPKIRSSTEQGQFDDAES